MDLRKKDNLIKMDSGYKQVSKKVSKKISKHIDKRETNLAFYIWNYMNEMKEYSDLDDKEVMNLTARNIRRYIKEFPDVSV